MSSTVLGCFGMGECQIADKLQRKNVDLQVLSQNINTGDATGRLEFNNLGAIAQFETEIRAERQMDGIQKAKERCQLWSKKKANTRSLSELDIYYNENSADNFSNYNKYEIFTVLGVFFGLQEPKTVYLY